VDQRSVPRPEAAAQQGRGAPGRPHVVVIGSGVAGLAAAYTCSAEADVTLLEADDRLGGHAHTHDVVEGDRVLRIDTGFIVHNRRTYPTLLRIFDELGVPTQPSEMSMSILDEPTGVEWAGARGLRGVLPSAQRAGDPRHLRMLAEIPRFHRAARALLERESEVAGSTETLMTMDEFVSRGAFSERLRTHFVEPLIAAVWSCDPEVAGRYPAVYLFRFLAHHGMLSVSGSPTWRTVTGGSRTYVDALVARLRERGATVRTGAAVARLSAVEGGAEIVLADGTALAADHVIVATHPGQALALLAEPTALQREVLGALGYSPNRAVLHTDVSVMPSNRRTWSSWNFRRRADRPGHVTVTYDLTRLQRLDTQVRYLVTLGGSELIDPATVIAEMDYEHPLYTPSSVAAQARLGEIEAGPIAFAGAYHGWGFHEDGAASGVAAAQRLGYGPAPSSPAGSVASAAPSRAAARPTDETPVQVYATEISHLRRAPLRAGFRHRSYLWLVEVGADSSSGAAQRRIRGRLAAVRRWATGSIQARDHLGDPGLGLRANLAHFLELHGIELGEARVRLAAHPRAFGFCFNPISVWWCTRPDGTPLATVVEVHNTYGDRHAYLVRPDGTQGADEATVAKEMYVSPFHGVDGDYRVRAPEPGPELSVSVDLTTAAGTRFSASLSGTPVTGHRGAAALAGLRDAGLIRLHGVALWLRRLPIQPRPLHHQEGVR
jgi:uncharacterized protein